MGFDQKAEKLVGQQVEVKMYNGLVISGKMSSVNKGYVCFITTLPNAQMVEADSPTQELQKPKTTIRRLALRDITSMVAINAK